LLNQRLQVGASKLDSHKSTDRGTVLLLCEKAAKRRVLRELSPKKFIKNHQRFVKNTLS
jgi:hypothetical protein